jgi:hypothetical protein
MPLLFIKDFKLENYPILYSQVGFDFESTTTKLLIENAFKALANGWRVLKYLILI